MPHLGWGKQLLLVGACCAACLSFFFFFLNTIEQILLELKPTKSWVFALQSTPPTALLSEV